MAVRVEIRLRKLDRYIRLAHGAPRALTPLEEDVLERFAMKMLQAIRDRWPVDTGTSRDAWNIELKGLPGQMAFIIENPMYYVEYVHDELWERLIPAVWKAVEGPLMFAIKAKVDRTEREIKSLLDLGGEVLDIYRAGLEGFAV
jgi:hypothetical protein